MSFDKCLQKNQDIYDRYTERMSDFARFELLVNLFKEQKSDIDALKQMMTKEIAVLQQMMTKEIAELKQLVRDVLTAGPNSGVFVEAKKHFENKKKGLDE